MKNPKASKGLESLPAKSLHDADDFEADDAVHTLTRAERIKANPELMARVHKVAGRKIKHMKAIRSIKDIKDTWQDMVKEENEELKK